MELNEMEKSLLFLKRSIDRDLIVTAQREALQTLRCALPLPGSDSLLF